MQNLVIDQPYVAVPPYHGRLWPRVLALYSRRVLRRSYGIESVTCRHSDRLAASISAGHGVILAPNHCRDEDPMVLATLARDVGTPMFIMASWHLFKQQKLKTFLLRRAGAFSIYREGIDRAAVNTAIDILTSAERPLIMFPEGFIARTNDRLNDMMDGIGLIARTAAKRRAKESPNNKVVVHPIALRYNFHGNIDATADKVLGEIESRLSWRPQKQLSLIDRIVKVGGGLLSLKEIEYLGEAQSGSIESRLERLTNAILNPLEDEYAALKHDGSINSRVKRLRTEIVADMTGSELAADERERRWKQLADVYLANELSHYPPNYVRSNPTAYRILETLERFEEDLTDKVSAHGHISAEITVGEAIEVAPGREPRGAMTDGDALLQAVAAQLKAMLGIGQAETAVDA